VRRGGAAPSSVPVVVADWQGRGGSLPAVGGLLGLPVGSRADVRFWHKADIAAVLSDVAFGGNAHNLIRASHVPCGRLVRLTLGLHRAQ
jgi:hypothetical protein